MYATTIDEIENAYLHDAAFVLSLRKGNPFRLRSLYMDKSGECAISYYGRLNEHQIKEVIQMYSFGDVCLDNINPVYRKDFTYDNGHHANGESEYTTIYTPDGVDYRNWEQLNKMS